MNIKRLCLIAGLLSLPVAYANAADITINVPVEIDNFPAANTKAKVACSATIGIDGALVGTTTAKTIIPSKGRPFRATVPLLLRSVGDRSPDEATHYKCRLVNIDGEPALPGRHEVSGVISR